MEFTNDTKTEDGEKVIKFQPLDKIMVSQKTMHKGIIFGQVGYGGGMIDLGNGYGLQFILNDSQFVTAQLFLAGVDKQIKSQSWKKPKMVKYAAPKKPAPKPMEKATVSETAGVEEIL